MNLPDGYTVIDAFPAAHRPPTRIGLVVRRDPAAPEGPLRLLRVLADARVYLGCLVDTQDRVHRWLEVWFQEVERAGADPAAARDPVTNASLDRRWTRTLEALERTHPDTVIRTGWETANPSPLLLDLRAGTSAPLAHPESGTPLELCRDEALLAGKGLPGYAASRHRYLYGPALGDRSPLVPVTPDAPTTEATVPLEDLFASGLPGVLVNRSAGRVLVRSHPVYGYEAVLDLLGGVAWSDLVAARLLPEGPGPRRDDAAAGALHPVFDRVLEDLDHLRARARSLMGVDRAFNREVRAVIRGLADGLEDDESGREGQTRSGNRTEPEGGQA